MNPKYVVGRSLTVLVEGLLRIRALPLVSAVPYGHWLPYDLMRYAGTKRFDVILDVGANVGQTHGYLRPYFPDAEMHCFEPVPATFRRLSEAIARDGKAKAHQVALSNHTGSVGMKLFDDSQMATVTSGDSGADCQVPSLCLDDFARQQGFESIDLLKLDVEGHELQVLEGARRLFRENRIQAVYAEVGFSRSDTGHTPLSQLNEALDELGLCFVELYDVSRNRSTRYRAEFGNVLFWNPNFARKR